MMQKVKRKSKYLTYFLIADATKGFERNRSSWYEIIRNPDKSLDESMMEFILSKVALISCSITLLKTNIIPGQHQQFWPYFQRTN